MKGKSKMIKSGVIPEKLAEFIRGEAKKADYKLVDISPSRGRTFSMEVVIDKEGGITLDECGSFNRKITSWIDEHGMFAQGYTLDVCSPGLDRVLKSDADFSWAIGKRVEVRTHKPMENGRGTVGKLLERAREGSITIEEENGSVVRIDGDNVAKVRLNPVL